MFDDKTQSNQRIQNLDNRQGAAKVAPPVGLPTGTVFAPASIPASTPPTPAPSMKSTSPSGKNETADDIFDGVNEPSPPSPAPAAAQPTPLSTAPLNQAVGNSVPKIGIGNGNQQQPPATEQQAALPEQMMNGVEDKKLSNGKKILIILISVVLVTALAALGYWLYGKLSTEDFAIDNLEVENTDNGEEAVKAPPDDDVFVDVLEDGDDIEETVQDIEQGVGDDFEEGELVVPPLPQAPVTLVDTDGDGLTDEEELALGTNFQASDSDNDGLSDRDEVEVYQTDPLNQDSDGDGYLDGDEVENGYDPKGPGRLLELP